MDRSKSEAADEYGEYIDYYKTFKDQDINGKTFILLTEQRFQDPPYNFPEGPVLRIVNLIEKLKKQEYENDLMDEKILDNLKELWETSECVQVPLCYNQIKINDRLYYHKKIKETAFTYVCRVVKIDKDGFSVVITINNSKRLSPEFDILSSFETWILDEGPNGDARVPNEDFPLTKNRHKVFYLLRIIKKQYTAETQEENSESTASELGSRVIIPIGIGKRTRNTVENFWKKYENVIPLSFVMVVLVDEEIVIYVLMERSKSSVSLPNKFEGVSCVIFIWSY
ncbi:hypothetical protein RclHR1_01450024 [Rhizophagus clarus]|nr:hypothetical protein RclHR1_01450024 [Rhizophagus clarus]